MIRFQSKKWIPYFYILHLFWNFLFVTLHININMVILDSIVASHDWDWKVIATWHKNNNVFILYMKIVFNVFCVFRMMVAVWQKMREEKICYFFWKEQRTTKTHLFSWVTHCFYLILMINKQTSYYYFLFPLLLCTVSFSENISHNNLSFFVMHTKYSVVRHNGLFWLQYWGGEVL